MESIIGIVGGKSFLNESEYAYWESFGYKIGGPVSYAFTNWIVSEIRNDCFSDIIFIARDGYLPCRLFSNMWTNYYSINIHYIYAPRSIAMTNSIEEQTEYEKYIKNNRIGKGKVAIVDTITVRFSAQRMILKYIPNPIVGFYWCVGKNISEGNGYLHLDYRTFQDKSGKNVPNWSLVEFIFSAPERPIRAISDGDPIHYQGNSFETERLNIFSYIEQGVMRYYSRQCETNIYLNYCDILSILDSFYFFPSESDKEHFSEVRVSTLPDHSDNYPVEFFASSVKDQDIRQNASFRRRVVSIANLTKLGKIGLALFRKFRSGIDIRLQSMRLCRLPPEKLAKKLVKYDVISFDVFDTLIFRTCDKPTDVFKMLEEKNGLFDFQNTRINAENEANILYPEMKGQVTLSQIYSVLQHYYGKKIHPSMENEEFALEKLCCYANPHLKAVIDILISEEKKIICISDMYLSSDKIKELLLSCGYDDTITVFSSCDFRCGKADGGLQRKVGEIVGAGKKIAHVGDNYLSDYLGSKSVGWDAFYVKDAIQ